MDIKKLEDIAKELCKYKYENIYILDTLPIDNEYVCIDATIGTNPSDDNFTEKQYIEWKTFVDKFRLEENGIVITALQGADDCSAEVYVRIDSDDINIKKAANSIQNASDMLWDKYIDIRETIVNEALINKLNPFCKNLKEDKKLTFEELSDKYVPSIGKADTKGGELVRAVDRIIYRFYNDGDIAGVGYGKETVNPAVRFLAAQNDENLQDFAKELFEVKTNYRYGCILKELKEFITDYVQAPNLNLLNEPNTEDYQQDYKTEEDIDDEEY